MVISPVHFPSYRFWPRLKRGDLFFDSVFYFRRGSWALAHGLLALAKKRKKESLMVWFPDYFCSEPLEILKQFSITIAFYPVTRKLTPDWETLAQMADTNAPDALLLVHYFGFPNDIEGSTIFCKRFGIDLVEDCAHVMEPFGAVGTSGVFSIWSPWKFFPLPELGILWVRDDLQDCVEILPSSREVLPLLRWWAKREVQRALRGIGVHWYRGGTLHSPPLRIRGGREGLRLHAVADNFSLQLLKRYIHSADALGTQRVENYHALETFFKERYPETLIIGTLSKGVIPYAFSYIASKPAVALSKVLVEQGIPAFLWPDLPEEVKRNKADYPWAHFYADHLLLFPVHQNISAQQMEYMKKQIAATLSS